ncbi:hypothetical protein KY316_01755, partial [Candidatus Woesearchaeota archaeon]|nr:hypothetical protein [Candidatus Woesearchaeota archaeon]
ENQEAEQAKLYESGFNDNGRHYEFEAVDAIITKGMKLPNFIGECYLPTRYVLNKNLEAYYSEFGDTKENRRKLRQTFLWLVKKGAIMHHHGKGKSVEESTVSINPHINEIKLGVLAEYMREKLGSNRTNGN